LGGGDGWASDPARTPASINAQASINHGVLELIPAREKERAMPELPLVGQEFAGYRIRSVIGRGGMSVVYQADNLRLGSTVALKVLAPELSNNDLFRTRFLEESRIAASLNHPNVIPIYDMGPHDDLLYIVMRYVAGTDMRASTCPTSALPSTRCRAAA
jgi:serine/threonine-protein kinase